MQASCSFQLIVSFTCNHWQPLHLGDVWFTISWLPSGHVPTTEKRFPWESLMPSRGDKIPAFSVPLAANMRRGAPSKTLLLDALRLVEHFIGPFGMLLSRRGSFPLFQAADLRFPGFPGIRIPLQPEETFYRVFATLADI